MTQLADNTVSRPGPERRLPGYIAVEGPIGVGKTTLATRIAEELGYSSLLEPSVENPFLEAFYRDARRNALPTQLYFLLHRSRQVADLAQDDMLSPRIVADFLLEKDELFARLTLTPEEFDLYSLISQKLDLTPRAPDLVIYLQASVDVLLTRIRQRGIRAEQRMETDYLSSLTDAYTQFFHFYDRSPLLIVNANQADFAHNDRHFQALLDQVIDMRGARQYFNPNPELL
ncbi:MAG: deoxynucleoside kinase [Pseudomonadales bacterium]